MEYNSHFGDGLVDQAKSDGKTIMHTTINIWEVQKKTTKAGYVAITLVGTDRRKFSNWEGIWDKQGIPVSDLNEGDELEITYVANGDFLNFLKVTRVL